MERKHDPSVGLGPYRQSELLAGVIRYPAMGYTGYGDGVGTDLAAFVSDEMLHDWEIHRERLMRVWRGEIKPDNWPHVPPWLDYTGRGRPWGAKIFDTRGGGGGQAKQRTIPPSQSAEPLEAAP